MRALRIALIPVGVIACPLAAQMPVGSVSQDAADAGLIMDEAPPKGRIVKVELEVDEEGRLAACRVVQSTGMPELDRRACRKIKRSVAFKPAVRGGQAVRETTVRRILLHPPYDAPKSARRAKWGKDGLPPAPIGPADYPLDAMRLGKQGDVEVAFDVTVQDGIENCRIVAGFGFADLDEATCRTATERVRYAPAKDDDGNVVRSSSTMRVHWRLPD